MATTIDKLDLSVHDMYALRIWSYEQTNIQFRLDQATTIPPQTAVNTLTIKQSEMDMLMGIIPYNTPWAFFLPPKRYLTRRRSPFSFSRVAPSLSLTDEGTDEYNVLMATPCKTDAEQKEKEAILGCFKTLSKLNHWLGFIVGRIGQFLQG